jgi:hypothetical protein
MATNCWEHKKCGREPHGSKVNELGICPAATCKTTDKLKNGKNGGRCCWAVVGTLCGGKVQGSFAEKMTNCMNCDFFKIVWKEEHEKNTYVETKDILALLSKCEQK